jgi:hypothetical protein
MSIDGNGTVEDVMRTLTRRLLVAFVIQAGVGPVAAQEPAPGRPAFVLPGIGLEMGGPSDVFFMRGHGAFEREVVKGAPFTADTATEIVQTLADGNRLVRKTTGRLARDTEGRMRREQTLAAIGGLLTHGEPPRIVVIHDAVAQRTYFVHGDERRAVRIVPGAGPKGERVLGGAMFEKRIEHLSAGLPEPRSETLESRDIEGLRAEGTRQTVVLPAGQVGNEKPIEIVSEQWRSPELSVTLQTRHQDPRFGTTEYRLENIDRREPDPSLFQVPAGYAIEDGPGRVGFMKRK